MASLHAEESPGGAQEVVSNTRTFDRRDLVPESGTGLEEKNGRFVTERSETVEQADDTRDGYRRMIMSFVLEAQRLDASVLDSEDLQVEKMFVEQFSSDKKDKDGNILTDKNGRVLRTVDEGKINTFLDTEEGWMLANALLERQTDRMLFALAMQASILPDGERSNFIQKLSYKNGIDAKGIGKFFNRFGNREKQIRYSRGKDTSFEPSPEAFQFIRQSQQMTEFMLQMYKIDVTAFELNASGEVVEREKESGVDLNANLDQIRKTIEGNLRIRQHFYEDLGFPPSKIDASPTQFIFRYADNFTGNISLQEARTLFDDEVYRLFDQRGGIARVAGPVLDGTSRRLLPTDRAATLKSFNEVQTEVMVKWMEQYAERVKAGEKVVDTGLDAVVAKAKEYDEGRVVEKKTKEATDQKGELEVELTGVEESIRNNQNNPREELSAMSRGQNELSLSAKSGETLEKTIEAERNTIIAEINTAYTYGGSIGPGLQERYRLAHIDWNTERTATQKTLKDELLRTSGKNGPSKEALERAEQQAEEAANLAHPTKAIFEGLLAKNRDRLSRLETLEDTVNAKRREADERDREVIKDSPKILNETQDAMQELQSVTYGLTINEIITLSVEELYQKAILSKAPGNKEEATQLREKILLAKADQRVITEDSKDPSPQDQIDAFMKLTSTNMLLPTSSFGIIITSDALLTMTEEQLVKVLEDPGGHYRRDSTSEHAIVVDEVQKARKEAVKRQLARRSAFLQEQKIDLESRIKLLDNAIRAGIDDESIKREREVIQVTLDLMNSGRGRGMIRGKEGEVAVEKTKFFDTNLASSSDADLSPAERDVKAPKGYYEIINLLLDYQNKPNRDEYFRQIHKVLTPQRIALSLQSSFELTGVRRSKNETTYLRNVFQVLQERDITPRDAGKALTDIIDRLESEVLAF